MDGQKMGEKNELYKKIYNLANENMQKRNMELPYSYQVFSSRIGVSPYMVDSTEFDKMSNDEIFTAIFLRCLDRLPEEGAWSLHDRLTQECRQSGERFSYALLTVVAESEEFKGNYKEIRFFYDTEPERKLNLKEVLQQKASRFCQIFFAKVVLPVWICLPVFVKNGIRKMSGKETKK